VLAPAGSFSAARYAETAAPNKIQFNGVGGLRTYIGFTGIGDQPSRRSRVRSLAQRHN
jgi:hypothetical protein